MKTVWRYDAVGQVSSVVHTSATGQVVDASVYSYDEKGNRTARRFSDETVETYAYDLMLRLVQAKRRDGSQRSFTLDTRGNRTQLVDSAKAPSAQTTTASFNDANQLRTAQTRPTPPLLVLAALATPRGPWENFAWALTPGLASLAHFAARSEDRSARPRCSRRCSALRSATAPPDCTPSAPASRRAAWPQRG